MSTPERSRETGYIDSSIDYDGRNGEIIRLGLAASPIGSSPELELPLQSRDARGALSEYNPDVYHNRTKRLLIEALGLTNINESCIEFNGNGSYGAGDEMFRLLRSMGFAEVLVPTYSFPNVAEWSIRQGIAYTPLVTDSLYPLESVKTVLGMGEELDHKIVYLDYPNNPFGQVDSQLMREVVAHVSEQGAIPLIDMAFGEVLGDEFKDGIQFVLDHGGIVLSSLSKTQGLPALRAGRAFISPRIVESFYHGGQRLVFGMTQEAQFIHELLYTSRNGGSYLAQIHAKNVADYCETTNSQLVSELENLGLVVASSSPRVPIQVVIAQGIPDFYSRLAREGLETESLSDYQVTIGNNRGFGGSAVRMLTPEPGKLKEVIRRVKIAVC